MVNPLPVLPLSIFGFRGTSSLLEHKDIKTKKIGKKEVDEKISEKNIRPKIVLLVNSSLGLQGPLAQQLQPCPRPIHSNAYMEGSPLGFSMATREANS